MSLAPGTRLGPYEIEAPLGAGGMGEVYRARDTRLDRVVAIKILPAQFSTNALSRQRFEREAKTISSLNHPNICTLHDIGSQDGVDYLVMECVEGETLAKRLEKGPLPLDQLLKYGAQIADALDKAHRSGVVHRDLKPGNIMLTPAGAKLLDFGLAKPAAPLMSGATLTAVATQTTPVTQEGTIVGTFQYMSPEQVEGKELDGRSDIFSLGAVLYEMLTGQKAFPGKSQLSVASAILEKEPAPISSIKPMTPPALDHAIRLCLGKDLEERWQTARDLALNLKWIAEAGSQGSVPTLAAERRRSRDRILMAVALIGVIAAVVVGVLYWNRTPADVHAIRTNIKPATLSSYQYESWSAGFALSPDGRWFTYVAKTPDGKSMLWLRSLDAVQDKPLPGTEKAEFPFWSPDSRFIAFFADAKLKKMEIAGSSPSVICDAPWARGGAWNREGTILFSPSFATSIQRVSANGGTPTPVTALVLSENENSHRWPFFLPDGRHFLYQSLLGVSPRDNPTNTIRVGSLDSKETKTLVNSDGNAIYASGHLIFLRQNALVAQPFDLQRLELTGEAVPIAEQVAETSRTFGLFSASQTGLLTYLDGAISSQRQLTWVDRSGKKLGDVLGPDFYVGPVLSPDGSRLTFLLGSSAIDVWVYDIARDVKTRLTFGSAGKESNAFSVWSPDGRSIAYLSYGAGKYSIRRKMLDGSGNEELLLETSEARPVPFSWSPDGKILAYHQLRQGDRSIWMLPVTGEHKPYSFLQSAYRPQFSPDGKWLAYCSIETGGPELFVTPFPGPGGKWQVSTEGGCQARWRKDGKELFFLNNDRKMMAADVSANGSSFEIRALRLLFETHIEDPSSYNYDVSSDGQRFICNYSSEKSTTDVTLVVNWDAELKKK